MFVKEEHGKSQRARWTNQLEGLREGDAHLANGDVIQNVGETDAGHGGDDQDNIHAGGYPEWRLDLPEGNRERQEQRRRDKTDHAKTSNRAEPSGRSLDQTL